MNDNIPLNEEILQALRTLKTLCKNFSSCTDCPCGGTDGCKIKGTFPANYNLNEPEEKWYAFRQ